MSRGEEPRGGVGGNRLFKLYDQDRPAKQVLLLESGYQKFNGHPVFAWAIDTPITGIY